MRRTLPSLLFLATTLALSACKREEPATTPAATPEPAAAPAA
ncbi:superoxide dismutase, partial [Xanthomonas sp. LMG 12462]